MGLCTSTKNLGSNPVVDYTKPAANYKVEPYPGTGSLSFRQAANALRLYRRRQGLNLHVQNHRFFDLRRWGILVSTLSAYIIDDIAFRTFMQGATFNPTEDDYWPIPQR